MPEYGIRFEIPDELDELLDFSQRRPFVEAQVAVFIRKLIIGEMVNVVNQKLARERPTVEKDPDDQDWFLDHPEN